MKNKKHKLLKFGSIGLLASVFGLAVVGYASKNNNYQPVKADNGTIQLTRDELNNYVIEYAGEQYNQGFQYNLSVFWNSNNETYQSDKVENGDENTITYFEDTEQEGFSISCINEVWSGTYTTENNVTVNEEGTLTALYQYIYNEENPQPTSGQVGSSIINAIKSGLGLIGDLASQFLIGFSTLFWNATAQALTPFGMFSLVMLGVAITFAVIKLVLNILRSNTGA